MFFDRSLRGKRAARRGQSRFTYRPSIEILEARDVPATFEVPIKDTVTLE